MLCPLRLVDGVQTVGGKFSYFHSCKTFVRINKPPDPWEMSKLLYCLFIYYFFKELANLSHLKK